VTTVLFKRGRFSLIWEPCDCWIGGYWSRKERALYVVVVPTLAFRWQR
jgi:hypothetical protein